MPGVSNEIGVQVEQIGRNKQMNDAEQNSELQENMHQVCGFYGSLLYDCTYSGSCLLILRYKFPAFVFKAEGESIIIVRKNANSH
jgi:hypothetical protein